MYICKISYAKIKSKWITYLNIKPKFIKFLGKKIKGNSDPGLGKIPWIWDKKKLINGTLSTFRTFSFQKRYYLENRQATDLGKYIYFQII